ncbi:hypothetical protein WKK05_08450 [Nostoc sp. UHCC 0302]|uniref:hypothetical protein n=1 Tax=Nostoc sp. UHCC 0302 TaxID=3134896 RepID=UPI00311CC4DF
MSLTTTTQKLQATHARHLITLTPDFSQVRNSGQQPSDDVAQACPQDDVAASQQQAKIFQICETPVCK